MRGAQSPQTRLRLGKIKRPDGRRNRCRVSGRRLSAQFAQFAGEVIDGVVGIVDHAKRFSQDVPTARRQVFDRSAQAAGAGQPAYSARRSTALACLCSNCSAQGGAPTPPPAPPARHSHGASCRFVPLAQPFRWRAPHSVAISRSMLCLQRLQRTSYRRLHRPGCSGNIRDATFGRCHRRV